MLGLLWFEGIGWETKLKEIGWVYVILFLLILFIILLVRKLLHDWKGGWDDYS